MDITNKPVATSPVTDDQELAKVLESMNKDIPSVTPPPAPATPPVPAEPVLPEESVSTSDTLEQPSFSPPSPTSTTQSNEIPMPSFESPDQPDLNSELPQADLTSVDPPSTPVSQEPVIQFSGTPAFDVTAAPTSTGDAQLDGIKRDVLVELRPLVDKLTLPADEKFDTLLLLIRSTDDKTLIPAAHEAAKSITDETKRAEALLDIIKEIDYFTNPKQS